MIQKFNYQGFSKQGGVYIIININNWKVYIGSTSCFQQRWRYGHFYYLNKGTHHNKYLQAAWNLDGSNLFEFHILQVMPNSSQEERHIIEQIYLNIHKNHCYNLMKEVSPHNGKSCYSNTPEDTFKKQSNFHKKLWSDPEYRKKVIPIMTKANIERYNRDPSILQRAGEISKNSVSANELKSKKAKDQWADPIKRQNILNKKIKNIQRKEALELNKKRYFTGKSCLKGHICERFTSNYKCIICSEINFNNYFANHKEEIYKKNKEYKRKIRSTKGD